jgi:hypothetical protein
VPLCSRTSELTVNTDNLDYNEIKHLIKDKTTQTETRAISIGAPKNAGNELDDFGKELYAELVRQHDRINLFVKSKYGEIQRRLDHLERQIRLVRSRRTTGSKGISAKRVEKFSRLETDVLRAGNEIQFLERFSSANRVGFTKLLKKYQKWTGNTALGRRFREEILDKDWTMTRKDFGALLLDYTNLLDLIRVSFESGAGTAGTADGKDSSLQGRRKSNSTSATSQLNAVYRSGSDVEVDAAFATVPLGPKASHATYWVHNDNIMQLNIVLLQQLRARRCMTPISSAEASPLPKSRQGSLHAITQPSPTDAKDYAGTIIYDSLRDFTSRRSNTTVEDIENYEGRALEEAMASIRYTPATGEAVVMVGNGDNLVAPNSRTKRKTKVKSKELPHLFGQTSTTGRKRLVGIGEDNADRSDVEQWIQAHKEELQPLAHLRCRRSRFEGRSNDSTKGIWAALDRDVSFENMHSLEAPSNEEHESSLKHFPHAILEIRWEGQKVPDIVKILDETHLVSSRATPLCSTLTYPSD